MFYKLAAEMLRDELGEKIAKKKEKSSIKKLRRAAKNRRELKSTMPAPKETASNTKSLFTKAKDVLRSPKGKYGLGAIAVGLGTAAGYKLYNNLTERN